MLRFSGLKKQRGQPNFGVMCEINILVRCPHCESSKVKRNGKKPNGAQNFYCQGCRKQFQAIYAYPGADPRIKRLAIEMTLHGSGIRDISQVLRLSPNGVIEKIRRYARKVPKPFFDTDFEAVEMDEFWSFVRKRKEQKRWVWYAYAPQERKILAFHIGKRNTGACKALVKKLKELPIRRFFTDDYKAYAKVIPPDKHTTGKQHTTHIERPNRDFRTHLKRLTRRTVCHSKSDEMHYQIIKLYIHHRNTD